MHPSGEGAGVQSSDAREGTALSSSTRARGSTNRQTGPVPDGSEREQCQVKAKGVYYVGAWRSARKAKNADRGKHCQGYS